MGWGRGGRGGRQRRRGGNLPGFGGLARRGASAALLGLSVVTTTACPARLASAPAPCQRGSRGILRQAPMASTAAPGTRADAGTQGGDPVKEAASSPLEVGGEPLLLSTR